MMHPALAPPVACVLLSALLLPATAAQTEENGGRPLLIPRPKQLTDHGRLLTLRSPDEVAIVIGDRASEPEKYAAERLQELIERRFGARISVSAEAAAGAQSQRILLGQRTTNSALAGLCAAHGLDLSADSPGHDGFVIEVLDAEKPQTILVGGCNPRGVVYGAQALFRLLRSQDDRIVMPVVSVRDRPSIPWRGRPYSRYQQHLEPGVLDAYMWAGLNFIDVRHGAFGFPPGFDLDEQELTTLLREAHRRGLFVWGTVSCGIKPPQFDAALATFSELIDLGVDGLWISFDDPGGGVEAMALVGRVLQLGREKGFTGRTIATTPPSGSYQVIDTSFNREMVKVPGMESATWFFTRVPCDADRKAAETLGLKRLPAWWHNWPRTEGGFTHGSYGGSSFRLECKPSYMEATPLTWGWHNPQYDKLRAADQWTDTVMLWGEWGEEYVCSALGVWAWEPKRHDWDETRQFIYSTVYGPSLARAAKQFDDLLHEVKTSFVLPERQPTPQSHWPPRLRPDADRADVKRQLAEMEPLLTRLEWDAPRETLIPRERLAERYLEPMRAEWAAAKVMADLPRPEAWWPDHEAEVLARLQAGDTDGVKKLCADARPRLERELAAIRERLTGLRGIDAYLKLWEARAAGGADYWREELRRRAQAFDKRMKQFIAKGLDVDGMLSALDRPPAEGKLIASIPVEEIARAPIRSRGAWLTGLFTQGKHSAFVMSFPGRTASQPGDYVQVTLSVPVPEFEGRLFLQTFLIDEYDSDRWTKYRFYQLLSGDEVIWEEDIALKRTGREWTSIDITDLARGKRTLELTWRLLDRRAVGNYTTTVMMGPVRLVEQ